LARKDSAGQRPGPASGSYGLLQRQAGHRRGLILLVDECARENWMRRGADFLDLIRHCPQALITVTTADECAPWADQVVTVARVGVEPRPHLTGISRNACYVYDVWAVRYSPFWLHGAP